MTPQENNQRIVKNTVFLYIRMIIIMLVSLFTSRVILGVLGVEDFGIYNMVGGIVAMFQIFGNTLTDATQRFLTIEIGKGEDGDQRKVFSTCLILHILLGLLVVVIAEPVGLWFLHHKLLIPPERMVAGEWLFQFSVISMFVMFISIPYNALIIAYEKMKAFAAISIIDAGLKLIIAYSLVLSGRIDRLILYGLLILILQIFIRFIYSNYSIRHFSEARFHLIWNKDLVKEIGCFSSWIIIGNTALMCITHGINLLLGMFFMPAVNAARGLAVQVETAVKMFTRNFQTAINPQITKSYAAGQQERMMDLAFKGARFSSFLLQIPTLPILLETETILNLWLPEVPQYTAIFIRLILLTAWVNCIGGNTLAVVVKATGNIRRFECCVVSIRLLVLPLGYICLRNGMSPVSVFWVYLLAETAVQFSNIYVSHSLVKFSVMSYIRQVICPSIIVALSSTLPSIVIRSVMPGASVLRLLSTLMICTISTLMATYFLGITKDERAAINSKIHKLKIQYGRK